MKLKTIVGLSLITALLVYVGTTLFGTQEAHIVGVFFFISSSILLSIVVLRSSSLSKGYKVFALFEVLIICAVFSLLLGGLKNYSVEYESTSQASQILLEETTQASKTNEYYVTYVDYLKDQVALYQENNNLLQSKIEEEKAKNEALALTKQSIATPSIPEPVEEIVYDVPYVNNNYHKREEEEDDD